MSDSPRKTMTLAEFDKQRALYRERNPKIGVQWLRYLDPTDLRKTGPWNLSFTQPAGVPAYLLEKRKFRHVFSLGDIVLPPGAAMKDLAHYELVNSRWWVSWVVLESDYEGDYYPVDEKTPGGVISWWLSGQGGLDAGCGTYNIVALAEAPSEEALQAIVASGWPKQGGREWRFCTEKPHDYTPKGDRFGLPEGTKEQPWYGTQGGGKAAYVDVANPDMLIFFEAPEDSPELLGEAVPEEWGVQGPFSSVTGESDEEGSEPRFPLPHQVKPHVKGVSDEP